MGEQIRFVIVGHVDHGKSTLIGRLLYDTHSLPDGKVEEIRRISEELGRPLEFGFICDNLEEERRLAQTIDTTQTFFNTAKRRYVIIDAPGHKELTKNMLTGASQADGAVLIVDAKEGLQEQTRRHAYLIGLLGIQQIMVVINKMDMVEYDRKRFLDIRKDIVEYLKHVGLKPMAVIPVSSMHGDNIVNRSKNITWYRGPRVLDCLHRFKAFVYRSDTPFRFPIQDRYDILGDSVYVGRVSSGTLDKGERLVFQPSGKRATVADIKVLWKRKKKASAGECIGLTLVNDPELARGEVASDVKAKAKVVNQVRANLFWMSTNPLKSDEPLTMRIATQEIPCKMRVLEVMNILDLKPARGKKRLEESDLGKVEVVSKSKFVAERFEKNRELGRFIVLRGLEVVAGGIVTRA